jgi:hypothetical protein
MDNPDTIQSEEFDKQLRSFDRTYVFSDDQRAYSAGEKQLASLKRLARSMDMSSEEFEEKTGYKL